MPVSHGGRHDGAVVLVLADAKSQAFALGCFGDRHEQLVIQLSLAGTEDNQRQTGRAENCLDRGHRGFRRRRLAVQPVDIERQHDQVRASGFGGLGPGGRIVHGLAPDLRQQRRPVIRLVVLDLDGDHGTIGRGRFEVHERQRRFTSHRDRFRPGTPFGGRRAKRDRANFPGPFIFGDFNWHSVLSFRE